MYYYSRLLGHEVSLLQVKLRYGLTPDDNTTDDFLSARGLYRIDDVPLTRLTFQGRSWPPTYTIVGNRVEKSHTAVDFPLDETKRKLLDFYKGAIQQASSNINRSTEYNRETVLAATLVDPADRSVGLQRILDLKANLLTKLSQLETTIESATTVAELRTLADTPLIEIQIGRNGRNINDGYISSINLINLVESDLELEIVSTGETLPYRTDLGGVNHFGGDGDEFLPTGNPEEEYLVYIRHSATGTVVARFECLEGANQATDARVRFEYDSQQETYLDDLNIASSVYDFAVDNNTEEYRGLYYDQTFNVEVQNGVFYVNGESQPPLVMSLGGSYRFLQEDITNTGHPLRIYDDVNKTNLITNGVYYGGTAGTSGAYVTFVPPATGTYSYQCLNHPGMGGLITVA